MEKVINNLILRIEVFKPIPNRVDWHFIFNILNYLTHSPLQEIPNEFAENKKKKKLRVEMELLEEELECLRTNRKFKWGKWERHYTRICTRELVQIKLKGAKVDIHCKVCEAQVAATAIHCTFQSNFYVSIFE